MTDQLPDYPDFGDDFSPEYSTGLFLEILNEQEEVVIEEDRIRLVCEKILTDAAIVSGRIGIVIVDNDTIHDLNRDFLQHDYPTDVISFQVESDPEKGLLEGEIIASAEMAQERAPEFEWSVKEELVLYIIHGLLHLVGYDDITAEDRKIIREKERFYLRHAGFEPNDLGFSNEVEEDEFLQDDILTMDISTHLEDKGELLSRLYDENAERN